MSLTSHGLTQLAQLSNNARPGAVPRLAQASTQPAVVQLEEQIRIWLQLMLVAGTSGTAPVVTSSPLSSSPVLVSVAWVSG
jgi:hypothetical protein